MISFDEFIMEPGSPIYQQILLYIKRGIVSGTVSDGDELPSRRVLSSRLGVNPNTVQKAYRLLEEEGLITSRTGSGSCMVLSPERVKQVRQELLEADGRNAVRMLKSMGLSKQQAFALIEKYWDGGESQ